VSEALEFRAARARAAAARADYAADAGDFWAVAYDLARISHARAEAMSALALRRAGLGAHPGPPRGNLDDFARYELTGNHQTVALALGVLEVLHAE
jgi:hypothetical protein